MMVSWKMILLISLWAIVNVDGKPFLATNTTKTLRLTIPTQPALERNEDTMKLPHDDESLQNNHQLNEIKTNVKILKKNYEPLEEIDDDSKSTSQNNVINIGGNDTFIPNGSFNLFSNSLNNSPEAMINLRSRPFFRTVMTKIPQRVPLVERNESVISLMTDVMDGSQQNNKLHLLGKNYDSTRKKRYIHMESNAQFCNSGKVIQLYNSSQHFHYYQHSQSDAFHPIEGHLNLAINATHEWQILLVPQIRKKNIIT